MKYQDEYRDADLVRRLAAELEHITTRDWTLMEICGGQTHSILKYGIDDFLPPEIRLVHGPGCPVCVTPLELIDQALTIARMPGVILTTFGDMMRVPGSETDFLTLKANGVDIRMVYSPLDAVRLAERTPDKEIVFFGVGFETTSPANAMAVKVAAQLGLRNFSLLASQVLVPPAIRFLMSQPDCEIQGFLAAGHVCTVMGYEEYEPLAEEFSIPIVVTGFEPVDILSGVLQVVRQLESGSVSVVNQYNRIVRREGNVQARQLLKDLFTITDRNWRGIGEIPSSGFRLREEYAAWDAEKKFNVGSIKTKESADCMAGQVMMGKAEPTDCPLFGTVCNPERPVGAPMVSSEGACAAYFTYRRRESMAGETDQI
ncbi:MAG: hydrogenase formation protein HypD [Bacteroidetes bacterium]|nr:hydrogenase formation protein HypD [Bacteroidota bacterium]